MTIALKSTIINSKGVIMNIDNLTYKERIALIEGIKNGIIPSGLELEKHVDYFKRTGEVSAKYTTYKGINIRVGEFIKYNSKHKGKTPYHKIRYIENYNERGNFHGKQIKYYWGTKRIEEISVYENGWIQSYKKYAYDGEIIEEKIYDNDYNPDDSISPSGLFFSTREPKIEKKYFEDGQIRSEIYREPNYELEMRLGKKYREEWKYDDGELKEEIYYEKGPFLDPYRTKVFRKEHYIKKVELWRDRVRVSFEHDEGKLTGFIDYDLNGNMVRSKAGEYDQFWYGDDGNIYCGYVYRVYHPVLKKYYIGRCFGQHPNGSYKGSGKLITKLFDEGYPREEWTKEILYQEMLFDVQKGEYNKEREGCGEVEEQWISKLDAVDSDEYLNLSYVGVYIDCDEERVERNRLLKNVQKLKKCERICEET